MSAERLTLLLSIRDRVAAGARELHGYHRELKRLHDVEMIPIEVALDGAALQGLLDARSELDVLIKAVTIDITGAPPKASA